MGSERGSPPAGDGAKPASALRRRVRAAAFAALLLPAFVLACFHRDLPSLGANHDDGVYLVTAKAIADGKGYRIESLPDERWQTKYPPAWPLALAAVWRMAPRFPWNAGLFLIAAWLALPTLILLQARMMEKLGFRFASQIAAALCILAFQSALLVSVTLLSDLWFCGEALFAMWMAERATEPGAHWRLAVAAGLAAALAYWTRTAGIVLLPSVAGVMLLKRRWRNALVFGAVLGFAVAIWNWWSHTHLHPMTEYNDIFYSSYLAEFGQVKALAGLLPRLASHASEFLSELGSLAIPGILSGTAVDWARRLAGILGVLGVVRLCGSGKVWHYTAFAALYILEMCAWPSRLFPRYVLPVAALWIAGLLTLSRYSRPAEASGRQPNGMPLWGPLVAAMLAFAYVVQCVACIGVGMVWRTERQALEGAYAWIARNAPPAASVVAFRDPPLYLYTGRHAEGLHAASGEDDVSRILRIAEFARRRGHRFVVIGPRDPEFDPNVGRARLSAALESDAMCRRVYSANGADVYDVTEPRSVPPR